jgi:hypothetical protein
VTAVLGLHAALQAREGTITNCHTSEQACTPSEALFALFLSSPRWQIGNHPQNDAAWLKTAQWFQSSSKDSHGRAW